MQSRIQTGSSHIALQGQLRLSVGFGVLALALQELHDALPCFASLPPPCTGHLLCVLFVCYHHPATPRVPATHALVLLGAGV